ncbi:hypothetical protein [Algoriphagus sp. CAU 1675]|nr:hypothetical protein [Algoriphagus sp. CAU 1675]MDF2159116.1 hypothetical protein [Algoriphagus sp. CAU 1675]
MTVPTGESPLSAGVIPILGTGCPEAKQVASWFAVRGLSVKKTSCGSF